MNQDQANPPPRGARGFVLVIAAVFMVAVSALAMALLEAGGSVQNASIRGHDTALAAQIAEMGMTRALAEAKKLAACGEMDLDRMLDPSLDSPTTTTDDNTPASAVVNMPSSSGCSYGGWGATTETVPAGVGSVYRKVYVDVDNNGVNDGAYLVRYDDNVDDTMATNPVETTGNNGAAEGPAAGGNISYRDRDQGVVITVIGIVDKTGTPSFASATGHITLRALLKASGGVAMIADGNIQMNAQTRLCGNGAIVCGSIDLSDFDCWCGTITHDGALTSSGVGSPPSCNTAFPGYCVQCASQAISNTAVCPRPPVSDPPALPLGPVTAAAFGNTFPTSDGTNGLCHFYLTDNAVHIWDRNADPACAAFTSADAVPAPDNNYGSWSIPADCWAPVFSTGNAQDRDGSNNWKPGSTTAGEIVVLDSGARTAAYGSLGLVTGIVFGDLEYTDECSCPSCNGTGPAIWDPAGGASTPALTLPTDGEAPRGTYYYAGGGTLHVVGGGTADIRHYAVAASGSAEFETGPLYLSNPVDANSLAAMANGNCELEAANLGFQGGVQCGGNLEIEGGANIRGNIYANGNVTIEDNNTSLCGGTFSATPCANPNPACDVATACAGGVSTIWVGGNIQQGGNPQNNCFCTNMRASGNIQLESNSNNNVMGGTMLAGGNIQADQKWKVNPAGTDMLGSTPQLLGVHQVSF
ncbi:MAG: hypothetical protein AB2A00_12580 [Myxococcota bacterium]